MGTITLPHGAAQYALMPSAQSLVVMRIVCMNDRMTLAVSASVKKKEYVYIFSKVSSI